MYSTRTRVHASIPNGHPGEEKRASDKSPRTSRRAERTARAAAGRLLRRDARRLPREPREDPRAEVGEEVRVGVGPVNLSIYFPTAVTRDPSVNTREFAATRICGFHMLD